MAIELKLPRPAPSPEDVTVHQLLHGYAEGHRLLESSITVPDDLVRLVLRLSDLSGTNMVAGFDEYITGYPLVSLNAYALAKTWYAPEMPRPGCVWTHTLVIPLEAMTTLPSLQALRDLFRRPDGHSSRKAYSRPLVMEPRRATEDMSLDFEVLKKTISVHYAARGAPVLLAARSPKDYEDLIFALWGQKWPHLRMDFTFCTGALGARVFGKRSFDIQSVPAAQTRNVFLDLREATGAEAVVVNATAVPSPDWAEEVVADASKPTGGVIRAFLWAAADDSLGRKDFGSLITVFDALKGGPPLGDLISLVSELFPKAQSAMRLKGLLLGAHITDVVLVDADEKAKLLVAGTTSDGGAFDPETLELRKRAAELCLDDADAASWLLSELFRSSPNSLGEEILAGMIEGMQPEIARRVTSTHPQFLPTLFQAKPSLASSPQLWEAVGDRKRELFEAVATHRKLPLPELRGLIRALLDTGSDQFIRRSLDIWGREAVFETLNWLDLHGGRMSETCRGALTFHVPSVMEWVVSSSDRSAAALTAIAHVVAPYSYQILQYDSTNWVRTLEYLETKADKYNTSYVRTLLLALAFGNAPPSPLHLISLSFERVHEEARTDRLSDDAWVIMQPLVPELYWMSNWDKCERLRRGLANAFIRHRWSPDQLWDSIRNRDLVKQILKSAKRVDGGERYFKSGDFSDELL